ncbi:hypothetical protein D9545_16470 [Geobacillus stearothermophilus]|nr:hypothetical protein D9545_16470 [Geobacillus stearothermophilus]
MRIFLQWFGLDTFTIQETSHFFYPLFSLCTPIFNYQVQLVVKSQLVFYHFFRKFNIYRKVHHQQLYLHLS